MAELADRIADFHVRLGRLEEVVLDKKPVTPDTPLEDLVEGIAISAALVFCVRGFGAPNHPYQPIFALLIVGSLYHRGIFPWPKTAIDWLMCAANTVVLTMLLKIVIGGGEPRPFHWLAYPTVEGGLTSFKITWASPALAGWELPLTVIQTFFLVLILFGTMIGFDLFTGLVLFVLIILAMPSLIVFDWNWALPGMIAALFSFYLQGDE